METPNSELTVHIKNIHTAEFQECGSARRWGYQTAGQMKGSML